jgi:hypothetical protein
MIDIAVLGGLVLLCTAAFVLLVMNARPQARWRGERRERMGPSLP